MSFSIHTNAPASYSPTNQGGAHQRPHSSTDTVIIGLALLFFAAVAIINDLPGTGLMLGFTGFCLLLSSGGSTQSSSVNLSYDTQYPAERFWGPYSIPSPRVNFSSFFGSGGYGAPPPVNTQNYIQPHSRGYGAPPPGHAR